MSKLFVDEIVHQSSQGSGTITIGASGETISIPSGATLTVPNGGLTGQNYPAFEAYVGTTQSGLAHATWTKIQHNTERFDTDNMYDNSSNYRFTPTIAGKYHVYLITNIYSQTTYQGYLFNNAIYKNGSIYYYSPNNANPAYDEYERTIVLTATIDMNGTTDYLEGYARMSVGSGTWVIANNYSYFGAFRIGA